MKQKEAYKKGTDEQFIEPIALGPWTSYSLLHDPKHMCFVLARYKFCSKILESKANILEIGCGDAFGTPIVAENAVSVIAIDTEERHILNNTKRLSCIKNITFVKYDICKKPIVEDEWNLGVFGGAFSIDVIEHLDKELEEPFMINTSRSLVGDGICIIGTPNITASKYATSRSKVQHINLHSYDSLRSLMFKYFKNVLMFSMNDEVVHTGYGNMAHYLFGVGLGVK